MTATVGARPESTIDLADSKVNHDPYPYYEQIRELGPAVWNPPSESWLVPGYENAKSVFSNFRDFAQNVDMYEDMYDVLTLPGLDNPRHNDLRAILGPYMSRVAADGYVELTQAVIDAHMSPVFERLRAGESVDVAGVYRTISTEVIARLLGVPGEDCPQFVTWAEQMGGTFDLAVSPGRADADVVRAAAAAGTQALTEYAASAIAERRRSGGTGMLSALASSDLLTEAECVGYVTMVIQGGQDTAATWAKNLTLALALHPDQRRALCDDRGLLQPALDEVIRWQAPVTVEVRVVRNAGVDIGGVAVEQGDNVTLMLAAAHRDPDRWKDPAAFDIHRTQTGSLGFGFGIHNCMGVNIARRFVTSLASTLLTELPDYAVAVPISTLDYGQSYAIRGAKELPLSL